MQEFLNRNDISIAFITETWLRPAIVDSVINIPGYTVLRKDRMSDNHGGVCIYLRNKYSIYTELRNLIRGFSSLIFAVVYHPHWSDFENNLMHDHLFQSLRIAD